MKTKVILFIMVLSIIGLSTMFYPIVKANDGDQALPIIPEKELKSIEGQKNIKDIKVSLEEAKQKLIEIKTTNKKEKEWIIRITADSIMKDKKINNEEILNKAKAIIKERDAWSKIAQEKYGVNVTDEEINSYISSEKDNAKNNSDVIKAAEGLNLSLDEFLYTFERDNFKRNLVWSRLRPMLEKQYPQKNNEDVIEYNNRLLHEYQKEVNNYLN